MHSAKSSEAGSAESRSDVARRCTQADANLDQVFLNIYIFIYLDVCMALNNGADITFKLVSWLVT